MKTPVRPAVGLLLRCLNLFMHDPYFLTWIICTDFLGDFVQFHAVYTKKNIHKLEDFFRPLDVARQKSKSCVETNLCKLYNLVLLSYFEFEIRFYIWSHVRVQYIDPMEYKWKRNRSFDMWRPPASFRNQIVVEPLNFCPFLKVFFICPDFFGV